MAIIMNTQESAAELGGGIRSLRLQKNLDQKTLGSRAGVSLTALSNLESGRGASVRTLVRVVRALGREDWLKALAPEAAVNPLHMLRGKAARRRARPRAEDR